MSSKNIITANNRAGNMAGDSSKTSSKVCSISRDIVAALPENLRRDGWPDRRSKNW
eukprot:CAMPEP_0176140062 /NCGR_PEP_ID=MMETSP0120_2-20121206/71184_1 /TAXON_ID=160619 /ORGANISM="Kryptoperidinium foliaceum, Strain CCMP 1326" /LENGTH=55 /DNA_ID=CAMNT_0017476101 /DNA_START=221 /DNA_END=385 /DNA_ORIENTATION=+